MRFQSRPFQYLIYPITGRTFAFSARNAYNHSRAIIKKYLRLRRNLADDGLPQNLKRNARRLNDHIVVLNGFQIIFPEIQFRIWKLGIGNWEFFLFRYSKYFLGE